ncbi:MAG: hypothetical protein K9N46_04475 [Candidatus Marinimicrobia bacterium]|nr:hypothetical protein [Candidatus Neomarinimicrobiota bacterium]MCF7829357.1 hypothetical protein [Candidatus Neomarinimicrobiota bacterium]MCF7879980.1 hypothetical protein [Candidatus Neomarinimicrobiota bacterium]
MPALNEKLDEFHLLKMDLVPEMEKEKLVYLDEFIKAQMKKSDRFHYLPLPRHFSDEITQKHAKIETVEDAKRRVKRSVLPYVKRVLNIQKEILAADLVTQEQQHSFIATKARSLGITATQLEHVLSSSYICIPVVYFIGKTPNDIIAKTNNLNVEIRGFFLWYNISFNQDVSKVEFQEGIYTRFSGLGEYKTDCKMLNWKLWECAYLDAVSGMQDLLSAIFEHLSIFRHYDTLNYVKWNKVFLEINKNSKLKVDDRYFVKEYFTRPDSGMKARTIGYIRVTDQKRRYFQTGNQYEAVPVFGGPFSKGMVLEEDQGSGEGFVALQIMQSPVLVKEGYLDNEYGQVYFHTQNQITSIYGFGAGIRMGHKFNIPLLFSYGTLSLGFQDQRLTFRNNSIANKIHTFQLRQGILKKFYFRQFGLFIGSNYLYTNYYTKIKDIEDNKNLMFSLGNSGLEFRAGFEITKGPESQFGIFYNRALSFESRDWYVHIGKRRFFDDEDDTVEYTSNSPPVLNVQGQTLGVSFTFR